MAVAKGTRQLNVGIATALYEQLQQFVEARGEKLRPVVEMALARHMASPPPVLDIPPLPPVTVQGGAPAPQGEQPAAKKRRPRAKPRRVRK
jgi:hypothetical protein